MRHIIQLQEVFTTRHELTAIRQCRHASTTYEAQQQFIPNWTTDCTKSV